MKPEYADWIQAHVSGTGYGRCSEVTEAMVKTFPELRRVRGHYYCPIWGERTHWWLETAEGAVVDPTAKQFPSGGVGEYIEWMDGSTEPTGKCINCGGLVFNGDSFCSAECGRNAVAEICRRR